MTVNCYILWTKAVDVEYIGKYKDQKAYSYWMSGFVDILLFTTYPVDSTQMFLKGGVSPFQKLCDDPHKVWICLEGTKSDRTIVTSWCTAGMLQKSAIMLSLWCTQNLLMALFCLLLFMQNLFLLYQQFVIVLVARIRMLWILEVLIQLGRRRHHRRFHPYWIFPRPEES